MIEKKGTDGRRPSLFGRGKELELIGRHLKAVQMGEGARVIAVTGEAGIGKTRLVQTVTEKLEGRGTFVLSGRCLFQETAMPYLPFIDILSVYLSKKGSDIRDRARYNIPVGLTGLDDEPEKLQKDIKNLVRGSSSILSKLSDKEFRDEREWMFSVVSQGIRDLARSGPVVIILDDLQFVDKASLQLFDHLVHRMKGERFLFVVAYRPEEIAESSTGAHLKDLLHRLSSERLLTEVLLKPLAKSDSKCLALSLLEVKELPDRFIGALHKETGGNP